MTTVGAHLICFSTFTSTQRAPQFTPAPLEIITGESDVDTGGVSTRMTLDVTYPFLGMTGAADSAVSSAGTIQRVVFPRRHFVRRLISTGFSPVTFGRTEFLTFVATAFECLTARRAMTNIVFDVSAALGSDRRSQRDNFLMTIYKIYLGFVSTRGKSVASETSLDVTGASGQFINQPFAESVYSSNDGVHIPLSTGVSIGYGNGYHNGVAHLDRRRGRSGHFLSHARSLIFETFASPFTRLLASIRSLAQRTMSFGIGAIFMNGRSAVATSFRTRS